MVDMSSEYTETKKSSNQRPLKGGVKMYETLTSLQSPLTRKQSEQMITLQTSECAAKQLACR